MDSEELGALVATALGMEVPAAASQAVPVRPSRTSRPTVYETAPLSPGAADGPLDTVAERLAEQQGIVRVEVIGRRLCIEQSSTQFGRSLVRLAADAWRPSPLIVPSRWVHLRGTGRVTPDRASAVVGPDAVAYFTARAPGPDHQPVWIDPEEAVRRTPASPLFLVQYAHARAAALASRSSPPRSGRIGDNQMPETAHAWESDAATARLAVAVVELPATVTRAARRAEAQPVARHLEEVADAFLRTSGRRRREVDPLVGAATRGALRAGLSALGIQAPTRC